MHFIACNRYYTMRLRLGGAMTTLCSLPSENEGWLKFVRLRTVLRFVVRMVSDLSVDEFREHTSANIALMFNQVPKKKECTWALFAAALEAHVGRWRNVQI